MTTRNYKSVPCRFYQENSCKKGLNCTFAHSAHGSNINSSSSSTVQQRESKEVESKERKDLNQDPTSTLSPRTDKSSSAETDVLAMNSNITINTNLSADEFKREKLVEEIPELITFGLRYSDFTFIIDSTTFQVHRAFIAHRSTYFSQLFDSAAEDGLSMAILPGNIADIGQGRPSIEALHDYLKCIYHSNHTQVIEKVLDSNARNIIKMALYIDDAQIIELAENHLIALVENQVCANVVFAGGYGLCDLFTFALQYRLKKLAAQCQSLLVQTYFHYRPDHSGPGRSWYYHPYRPQVAHSASAPSQASTGSASVSTSVSTSTTSTAEPYVSLIDHLDLPTLRILFKEVTEFAFSAMIDSCKIPQGKKSNYVVGDYVKIKRVNGGCVDGQIIEVFKNGNYLVGFSENKTLIVDPDGIISLAGYVPKGYFPPSIKAVLFESSEESGRLN